MKKFNNKTITVSGTQKKYSELIEEIVNHVPKEGLSVSDFRDRVRILDVTTKSNGTIELEDADCVKLKEYLSKFRFGVVSKTLLQFVNEIESL